MACLVYANDRKGNQIFGDIDVLIQEIRNGKNVRMLIEFKKRPNQEYITEAQCLWIKNNIVYAQNIDHVSVYYDGDVLRFKGDAYYWMILVDTKGNIDMSRWNVGEPKDRGRTQDKVKIKWFVY